MARVEIDFFGIERENAARFHAVDSTSVLTRGGHLSPGICGSGDEVGPRANPGLMGTSIASGSGWPSAPSTPFLVSDSAMRGFLHPGSRSGTEIGPRTAPLTIFYNGVVAVYALTPEKAEALIGLAQGANVGYYCRHGFLPGDLLPLARRKSLQRFLERRKYRLTAAPPYTRASEVGATVKEEGTKKSSDGMTTASNF